MISAKHADASLWPAEQRTLIEHLLRERNSLRGVCRAVGVSLTWLLHCMVEGFVACPEHLYVQQPSRPTTVVIRPLAAEADEMWSVVQKKANRQWMWMAMEVNTRQIIAFPVRDAVGTVPKSCGPSSQWYTVNRPRSIPIDTKPIKA